MTKSYWIDGYFHRFWNQDKVWYCYDRDIFVPKFATIKNDQENNRIYITSKYAKSKMDSVNNRILRGDNVKDMRLLTFVKALNVHWEKEPYIEPEAQFRVSLP